jgi:DNA-directed RNA polymerase specialized sigma24 family protein
MIRQGNSSQPIQPQPTSTGASAEPTQIFQLTMLRAMLLPPRCRDVYVLREFHGYRPAEIATALGMSKTDVKRHLRRALREVSEK